MESVTFTSETRVPAKDEIVAWLETENPEPLFEWADLVRKRYCGDQVHLRGVIEFSNECSRNCLYCGLRKANSRISRYRMSPDEIFESAKEAESLGYKTIVLQSGESDDYPVGDLCEVVKRIKGAIDCAVTLCVGEKSYGEYEDLRKAGADRYLLKFETSNEALFKELKPDSGFKERLERLKWLKELGFQVGSGNIVGLPGQTAEMLAEDLLFMKELDLDMIGVGPFIPHPETPLGDTRRGSLDWTLRGVALARILTRDTNIPATTAVGSIDPDGREKALRCGANVIMPNLTPVRHRKHYEIYPNKICLSERPSDCGVCVTDMIASLGRKVAKGYGHRFKQS